MAIRQQKMARMKAASAQRNNSYKKPITKLITASKNLKKLINNFHMNDNMPIGNKKSPINNLPMNADIPKLYHTGTIKVGTTTMFPSFFVKSYPQ